MALHFFKNTTPKTDITITAHRCIPLRSRFRFVQKRKPEHCMMLIPIWGMGNADAQKAYYSDVLKFLERNDCQSVAVELISDTEAEAAIAYSVFLAYAQSHEVYLFSTQTAQKKHWSRFWKLWEKKEHIPSYPEDVTEEKTAAPADAEAAEWIPLFPDDLELEEDPAGYLEKTPAVSEYDTAILPPMEFRQPDPGLSFEEVLPEDYELHRRLADPGKRFTEKLYEYFDDSTKDSDIYKPAKLDRRQFSKIRSEQEYNPLRKTIRGNRNYIPPKSSILALAFAHNLDLAASEDLLLRAGYTFSPSITSDIVTHFCIETSGNLETANQYLFYFGQASVPVKEVPPSEFTKMPETIPPDLIERVKNREVGIGEKLSKLVKSSGQTATAVCEEACVSQQTYWKITTRPEYIPSKRFILAFAVALQLTLEDTVDLLRCAGYAFSPSFAFDIITKYFFEKEEYDFNKIDRWLREYDQEALGGKWGPNAEGREGRISKVLHQNIILNRKTGPR